jgi:DNA-binding NarL/FixJ family response regulator
MTIVDYSPASMTESHAVSAAVIGTDGLVYRRVASALARSAPATAARRIEPDSLTDTAPGDLVVAILGPDGAGRERLKELRRFAGSAPLILVSPTLGPALLRKAIDAGVDGIVSEHQIESRLVPTTQAAATGQVVVPREALNQLRRPALSAREKQTLGLVILGFSNAEIARKLYLAESTVKSHLSSAFEKLGVRSRNEAAAVILDPETGLGTGILAIDDAEPAMPRRRLRDASPS